MVVEISVTYVSSILEIYLLGILLFGRHLAVWYLAVWYVFGWARVQLLLRSLRIDHHYYYSSLM